MEENKNQEDKFFGKDVAAEEGKKQLGMFFGAEHSALGGVYTLSAEDGDTRDFVIVDVLEHNGKEYAFMMPLDLLESDTLDLGNISESMVVWVIEDKENIAALETEEEYTEVMNTFVKKILGSMSAQASDTINTAIADKLTEE